MHRNPWQHSRALLRGLRPHGPAPLHHGSWQSDGDSTEHVCSSTAACVGEHLESSARTAGRELSGRCPLRPGFSLRCKTLARDSQAHACCVLRITSACTNLITTLSARRCAQVAPSHRGTPGDVGGLAVTAGNPSLAGAAPRPWAESSEAAAAAGSSVVHAAARPQNVSPLVELFSPLHAHACAHPI